jgi:hypothetical protein
LVATSFGLVVQDFGLVATNFGPVVQDFGLVATDFGPVALKFCSGTERMRWKSTAPE